MDQTPATARVEFPDVSSREPAVDRPRMYRPAPPLANHVDFYGYWDGGLHQSRALPRGAATIIIDLSGRPDVDFYAADAATRLSVPPAFIAGAGTASYVTRTAADRTVMTVHFRPAGASPFVAGLADLENACVGLADVWGHPGAQLRERLIDAASMGARIALVESFLLSRLASHGGRPHPGVAGVLESVDREPSARVADIQAAFGYTPKRLTALFRAEVGLAPKAYQRVRRLQGALRRLDAGATPGATIAADLGYFDQAHFVREFKSFTAVTPTQYVAGRASMPSHIDM